ncbi:MAG TPA: MBOAT family O-acyltransferase [Puia sp.]|nr:MBOAT family O-acyltransferase [Puia sp.]
MLFNSINFWIFFVVVFILYWLIAKNLLLQNTLLLIASYFFYSCWNWHFLFLLMFSTLLDYFSGLKISQTENKRLKLIWLWLSISINLGFLGVFKYYNFFANSFKDLLIHFGLHVDISTLNVILPIGISFYTFHGLSYIIDIYKNRISSEKNIIDYAVFVSFFPLLVAGPIERATHLLPQIKRKRTFEYSKAIDGMKQILWGLFKKIVIADNCADYANLVFNNSSHYPGSILLIGAGFFAFQIYCDFSGYSDIALGTARLLGIELLRNFAFPYFSRDIAEFWRRWHISLTTWFRDYLYIPLGGSRGSLWKKIRNTFIIFIVSGFWHGANWTFIIWGFLNAVYFLPLLLLKMNRKNLEIVSSGKLFPTAKELVGIVCTFCLTTFAWIFFRAENVTQAFYFIKNIFSTSVFKLPKGSDFIGTNVSPLTMLSLLGVFFAIEWIGREQQFAIANLGANWKRPLRFATYYGIILMIFWFGGREQQFIYFQF